MNIFLTTVIITEITLRGFRIKQKLTQKEMAEKLGYTQAYISRVEDGKVELTEELMSKLHSKFKPHLKGYNIIHHVKGDMNTNSHNTGGNYSSGDNRNNTIIPEGYVPKAEADAYKMIIELQKQLIEEMKKNILNPTEQST